MGVFPLQTALFNRSLVLLVVESFSRRMGTRWNLWRKSLTLFLLFLQKLTRIFAIFWNEKGERGVQRKKMSNFPVEIVENERNAYV